MKALNIAAQTLLIIGGLTWGLVEKLKFGRASMVGVVTGVIAGLAFANAAAALGIGQQLERATLDIDEVRNPDEGPNLCEALAE